jgi:hypothetical protein
MAQITSTPDQLFELVRSQHRDIEELISPVMDTTGNAFASAFTALRRFLAAHAAAEGRFVHFYSGSATAPERVGEDRRAGQAIARLEAIGPSSAAFDTALAELVSSLRAHALAEEMEVLPAMAMHAAPDELGRANRALMSVPDLAGQQGGPIEAAADFAAMLDAAKREFALLIHVAP